MTKSRTPPRRNQRHFLTMRKRNQRRVAKLRAAGRTAHRIAGKRRAGGKTYMDYLDV